MTDVGALAAIVPVPINRLYKNVAFAGDPSEALVSIETGLFFFSATAIESGVAALVATSSLTATATDTVLPASALTAASTLTMTADVTGVGESALTAASTLTTTADVIGVGESAADLVAASTLTVSATLTVPASVALTVVSTLTTTGTSTELATISLVATSVLTTAAIDTAPAAASLTAASTLTTAVSVTVLTTATLVAASTLTVATPVLAAVALSAASTLSITGTVIVCVVSLGAVTVAAGPVVALVMAQPGTLANPYAAADSDTRSIDFASALFVATEPVAITGPPAAPSVWYEFTESQVADWLASTSGFAHGAVIELYTGPHGATADDLTFIATDGSSLATLGAVTLSALVTTVATSLRAEFVDLGAVAVAANPAMVLS